MKVRIDAIMTTLNEKRHIETCIKSLFSQILELEKLNNLVAGIIK